MSLKISFLNNICFLHTFKILCNFNILLILINLIFYLILNFLAF